MSDHKAVFIGAVRDRNPLNKKAWEHTELVYEYRGHQYSVTKDNNGYMGEPLWKQHQEAQKRIDDQIERSGKPVPEWNSSAWEAFEELYEFFEKGE